LGGRKSINNQQKIGKSVKIKVMAFGLSLI